MSRLRTWICISTLALAGCAAGSNDASPAGGEASGGGGAGAGAGSGQGAGSGEGGDLLGGGDPGVTGIDPDDACLKETFGAEAAPAFLLFQIDVSGSMNCPPTDAVCATAEPTSGSRWEVFRAKLSAALDTLPTSSGAGLMHYPTGKGTFSGDPTGCVPQTPDVPIAELSTSEPAIGAALAAIAPAGGTPTHDAVTAALAQLDQANVPGAKYLVLATDGQATFCGACDLFCSSDELAADNEVLIAEVAAAAAKGIRTFVLGAPGSGPYRSVLSRIAEAGQTAVSGCAHSGPAYCHQDMTTSPDFGAALEAALAAVGGAALSCTYDIPPDNGDFDPGQVNVQLTVDGATTQVPQDKAHGDGWDYSADGAQILLYGPTCEDAKAAMGGKIEILYGCPTIVK